MPGLLLAPYNASMRLGQGYNSFLQTPCIDDAVSFNEDQIVIEDASDDSAGISQVVSYSSRFVEKLSDVARSMNISAPSSIRAGSVEMSGNSLSIDEAKFASSDLNAVVSVKVVNQTTRLVDSPKFQPIENVTMTNEKFFKIYGDCYISGFIEGGDLHGIVSIKVMDVADRRQVEKAIKGLVNGSSMDPDFTLHGTPDRSAIETALSQTETTITVNWSGGGQIKPENAEWSMENLFRAAAAFPTRVAACPQRTWAILTKYDNNQDFVRWADSSDIKVPQYEGVQSYTSDLLDMYMEYKNNLARLQDVLTNPTAYVRSLVPDAINISVAEIIRERQATKKMMASIVKEIDKLCSCPEKADAYEEASKIEPPEIWATRLPVLRKIAESDPLVSIEQARAELSQFSFVSETIPTRSGSDMRKEDTDSTDPDGSQDKAMQQVIGTTQESTTQETAGPNPTAATVSKLYQLCRHEAYQDMSQVERGFVDSDENRRKYAMYRFGSPTTSPYEGEPFNGAVQLEQLMLPASWPSHLEVHLVAGSPNDPIIGWLRIEYDQFSVVHGNDRGTALKTMLVEFSPGELITQVRIGCLDPGFNYFEIFTSHERTFKIGKQHRRQSFITSTPPPGFSGLKGFYGCAGDTVQRVGAIWGIGERGLSALSEHYDW